jgi:hypothetical protein
MSSVATPPDRAPDAIDDQPSNDATVRELEAIRGWIAIAVRPRVCVPGQKLYWEPIPGAPVSVHEARRLADAGMLLVANRYQPERVDLVVRLPAASLRNVGALTPPQP